MKLPHMCDMLEDPIRLPADCAPGLPQKSGVFGTFPCGGDAAPPEPPRKPMGVFAPRPSTYDPAMYDSRLRRPQQERGLDRQDAAFVRWAKRNEAVVFRFCELALTARRRGRLIGAKAIFEALRYSWLFDDVDIIPDDDGWKLPNSHTSRLARIAAMICPEVERVFSKRRLQEGFALRPHDIGIDVLSFRRKLGL